jgi:hypothetical protein
MMISVVSRLLTLIQSRRPGRYSPLEDRAAFFCGIVAQVLAAGSKKVERHV